MLINEIAVQQKICQVPKLYDILSSQTCSCILHMALINLMGQNHLPVCPLLNFLSHQTYLNSL